jgi:hypothetical protein
VDFYLSFYRRQRVTKLPDQHGSPYAIETILMAVSLSLRPRHLRNGYSLGCRKKETGHHYRALATIGRLHKIRKLPQTKAYVKDTFEPYGPIIDSSWDGKGAPLSQGVQRIAVTAKSALRAASRSGVDFILSFHLPIHHDGAPGNSGGVAIGKYIGMLPKARDQRQDEVDGCTAPAQWHRVPDVVGSMTPPREEPSAMLVTTVCLDLAKRVFQVHGADAGGRVAMRRKLQRLPWCPSVATAGRRVVPQLARNPVTVMWPSPTVSSAQSAHSSMLGRITASAT